MLTAVVISLRAPTNLTQKKTTRGFTMTDFSKEKRATVPYSLATVPLTIDHQRFHHSI